MLEKNNIYEGVICDYTAEGQGIAKIDVVVDLDVADEELIARLSGRRVCLNCGATYHVSHLGGETKCAKCGEYVLAHRVCKACGTYDGKEVIKQDA